MISECSPAARTFSIRFRLEGTVTSIAFKANMKPTSALIAENSVSLYSLGPMRR